VSLNEDNGAANAREDKSYMSTQRAVLKRATSKAIPSRSHFGAGQTKDFGDNAEFKSAKPVIEKRYDERAFGI
ncbi:MAG: hypothetical protein ACREQ3_21710, partial [Candidatus Binatia bacterium]